MSADSGKITGNSFLAIYLSSFFTKKNLEHALVFLPFISVLIVGLFHFANINLDDPNYFSASSIILLIFGFFLSSFAYTSTIVRGYFNQKNFNAHKTAMTALPVALFTCAIFSIEFNLTLIFINSLYLIHHTYMQNYGIFRYFEKKENITHRTKITGYLIMFINFGIYVPAKIIAFKKIGDDFSLNFFLNNSSTNLHFAYTQIFKFSEKITSMNTGIYILSGLGMLILFVCATRKQTSIAGVVFLVSFWLYWALAWRFLSPTGVVLGHSIIHTTQTFLITIIAEEKNIKKSIKTRGNISFQKLLLGIFIVALIASFSESSYSSVENKVELLINFPTNIILAFFNAFIFVHFYTDSLIWRDAQPATVKKL